MLRLALILYAFYSVLSENKSTRFLDDNKMKELIKGSKRGRYPFLFISKEIRGNK
jgi:hypothetical protein